MSGTARTTEVSGGTLVYEVAGQGPAVVLVHGLALDRRMWDDQFDVLVAAGHRVVRYDLRGFGGSSLPDLRPYTHTDDLRTLMARLEIPRAALVGLSMGGGIVLEFALSHPELVDALVLVDAVIRGYPFPGGWAANIGEVFRVAQEVGLAEAKELWLADPLFERTRRLPAVEARLRRMVKDYSGGLWLKADPRPRLDPPAVDRLSQITVPTLVAVGEHDLEDFQAMAKLLAAEIPRAQHVVIPDAGHLANMDAPSAFNGALLRFLASIQ